MAKSRTSPTRRSLMECRKREWPAFVCERHNTFSGRKHDAFNFGDVLVMDGQQGALLIQACADNGGDMSRRVNKIKNECTADAKTWLQAGNRVQVWGWGQRVGRNKDGSKSKVKRWTLRVVDVVLEDFA